MVRLIGIARHIYEGLYQAVADATADAPVREADGATRVLCNQLGIDVDLTEVVDQSCDAQAVGFSQNVIDQAGLAGS